MSNWLLLASWIAVMLLNAADSVMTRTALKKGYHERNRLIRALINELDRSDELALKLT